MMRWCALLTVAWVNALAQPRALHNISPARAAREISILRLDWQDLKNGHEGPSYFSVKRAPFRSQREIAEVSLFGQEAIGAVRFELVDESGRAIAIVPAMRTGSGMDADGYLLKIDVPGVPFRVRIRGTDLHGQTFEHTYKRLFTPMEGVPAAPIPPELLARFQDGDLRMGRASISAATYEPLLSPNGNPLGMRVRFVVRFDAPGYYDVAPHVFPVYQEIRWRGEIGMRALQPASGPVQYQANTEYPMTFDMVPAYVNRSPANGGYWLQAPGH